MLYFQTRGQVVAVPPEEVAEFQAAARSTGDTFTPVQLWQDSQGRQAYVPYREAEAFRTATASQGVDVQRIDLPNPGAITGPQAFGQAIKDIANPAKWGETESMLAPDPRQSRFSQLGMIQQYPGNAMGMPKKEVAPGTARSRLADAVSSLPVPGGRAMLPWLERNLAEPFSHGAEAINELGRLHAKRDVFGGARTGTIFREPLPSGEALDRRISQIEAKFAGYGKEMDKAKMHEYFIRNGAELVGQMANSILSTGLHRGMEGAAMGAIAAGAINAVPGAIALPEEVVTVPALSALGFTSGMTVGMLENTFYTEAGHAAKELAALRDKDGKPMDPDLVRGAGIAVGALNSALEVGGLVALGKFIKMVPGGSTLLRKGFGAAAAKAAAESPTLRKALMRLGKNYAQGVGGEVVTENLQEVVPILAEYTAKHASDLARGTDFAPTVKGDVVDPLRQALPEITKKTAAGMATLGLVPGAMGTIQAVRDSRQAARPMRPPPRPIEDSAPVLPPAVSIRPTPEEALRITPIEPAPTPAATAGRPAPDTGLPARSPKVEGAIASLARRGTLTDVPGELLVDGARLHLKEKGGALHVETILADKPGQGKGTAAMEMVLAEADAAGVPVTVSPRKIAGTSVSALREWYGRLGFVPAGKGTMVRTPQGQEPVGRKEAQEAQGIPVEVPQTGTAPLVLGASGSDPSSAFPAPRSELPEATEGMDPDANGLYYHVTSKWDGGDIVSATKRGMTESELAERWPDFPGYAASPDSDRVAMFRSRAEAEDFRDSFLGGEGDILPVKAAALNRVAPNVEGYPTVQEIPKRAIVHSSPPSPDIAALERQAQALTERIEAEEEGVYGAEFSDRPADARQRIAKLKAERDRINAMLDQAYRELRETAPAKAAPATAGRPTTDTRPPAPVAKAPSPSSALPAPHSALPQMSGKRPVNPPAEPLVPREEAERVWREQGLEAESEAETARRWAEIEKATEKATIPQLAEGAVVRLAGEEYTVVRRGVEGVRLEGPAGKRQDILPGAHLLIDKGSFIPPEKAVRVARLTADEVSMSLRSLATLTRERFGEDPGPMARSTDREAAQLVEDIGALAGANAILVKPGNLAAVPYHGVRYRSRNGKDIIAVIEGTERPAAVTALHEMLEEIKADFPEDYAKFVDVARQEVDPEKYAEWEFDRRVNSRISESDPDKLFDEFCNDLAGAQAERQEFWKNVLKKIPEVARRMAEILGRIIRRISRNLRKSSLPPRRKAAVEGVIRDLPRVRAVLEDVVASVAAKTEARRNTATTMPSTVQAARFSEREISPPFFSQLRRTLEEKMPRRATVTQVRAMVDPARGGGVKADELAWSGLNDFLAARQPSDFVSREEVLAAAREVQIKEIVKGSPTRIPRLDEVDVDKQDPDTFMVAHRDAAENGEVAFVSRQEREDGEDIWNVARGDEDGDGRDFDSLEEALDYAKRVALEIIEEKYADASKVETKFHSYQLPGGENYRELLMTFPAADGEYKSSHWSEPNVLAHVRFNERTDADNRRMLFIEEIQSDWHQDGRRKGYSSKGANAITETAQRSKGLPPPAPFSDTSKGWARLAVKRMIRWAAEHGFHRIGWTTGEQQAERYDLSKHVSEIIYWHREDVLPGGMVPDADEIGYSIYDLKGSAVKEQEFIKKKDLPDMVGKEVAQKILNKEGSRGKDGDYSLSGLDLKVGGEGMRAFYDRILPSVANDIGRRFGARVASATVEDVVVHSMDIPPAMKDSVMFDGQPEFSTRELTPAQREYYAAKEKWKQEHGHLWYHLTRENGVRPDGIPKIELESIPKALLARRGRKEGMDPDLWHQDATPEAKAEALTLARQAGIEAATAEDITGADLPAIMALMKSPEAKWRESRADDRRAESEMRDDPEYLLQEPQGNRSKILYPDDLRPGDKFMAHGRAFAVEEADGGGGIALRQLGPGGVSMPIGPDGLAMPGGSLAQAIHADRGTFSRQDDLDSPEVKAIKAEAERLRKELDATRRELRETEDVTEKQLNKLDAARREAERQAARLVRQVEAAEAKGGEADASLRAQLDKALAQVESAKALRRRLRETGGKAVAAMDYMVSTPVERIETPMGKRDEFASPQWADPVIAKFAEGPTRAIQRRMASAGEFVGPSEWLDIRLAMADLQERTGDPFYDVQQQANSQRHQNTWDTDKDIAAVFEGTAWKRPEDFVNTPSEHRVTYALATGGKVPGGQAPLTADEAKVADRIRSMYRTWEHLVKNIRMMRYIRTGELDRGQERRTATYNEGRKIFEEQGKEALEEWLDGQTFGIRENYLPFLHEHAKNKKSIRTLVFGRGFTQTRNTDDTLTSGWEQDYPLVGSLYRYVLRARNIESIEPLARELDKMMSDYRGSVKLERGMFDDYLDNLVGNRQPSSTIIRGLRYKAMGWFWRVRIPQVIVRMMVRDLLQTTAITLPKVARPFDPVFFKNLHRLYTSAGKLLSKSDPELLEYFAREVRGLNNVQRDYLNQEMSKWEGAARGVHGFMRAYDKVGELYSVVTDSINRANSFFYGYHAAKDAIARYRKSPTPGNLTAIRTATGFANAPHVDQLRLAKLLDERRDEDAARMLGKALSDSTQFMYDRVEKGLMFQKFGGAGDFAFPIVTYAKGQAQEIWKAKAIPAYEAVRELREKRTNADPYILRRGAEGLRYMAMWCVAAYLANQLYASLFDRRDKAYGMGGLLYIPGGPILDIIRQVMSEVQYANSGDATSAGKSAYVLDKAAELFVPGYRIAKRTWGAARDQDRPNPFAEAMRAVAVRNAEANGTRPPPDVRRWTDRDWVEQFQYLIMDGGHSLPKPELMALYGRYLDATDPAKKDALREQINHELRKLPISSNRKGEPRTVENIGNLIPELDAGSLDRLADLYRRWSNPYAAPDLRERLRKQIEAKLEAWPAKADVPRKIENIHQIVPGIERLGNPSRRPPSPPRPPTPQQLMRQRQAEQAEAAARRRRGLE